MAQQTQQLAGKMHSHNCRKVTKGRPKQYIPKKPAEGDPWTVKYSPKYRLIQHN